MSESPLDPNAKLGTPEGSGQEPRARFKLKPWQVAILVVCLVIFGFVVQGYRNLRPLKRGVRPHYIRLDRAQSLASLLDEFEKERMLRSAATTLFLARFEGNSRTVGVGTYQVGPSMSSIEILGNLRTPIRRMLRIPETNWSGRTARLLQLHEACNAQEYLKIVNDPAQVQSLVKFTLPAHSLEGYLYPDTYDIPPLLGAENIVQMQLLNFQKKVEPLLSGTVDPEKVLTIASLIQLEAGNRFDAPLISAVIRNRLAKNMPLQIDASLLYGIGKWRRLTFKDYKTIPGPYNLYTHKGLPPTPICSPTTTSIDAALHPASVDYLYYVALPNGKTVFATTYADHLKNIKIRKQMIASKAASPSTP